MSTKISKVYSAQIVGLSGAPISVETDVTNGLYSFTIVGLPDKSVEESRERVHAALKNSGFDSPKSRNHKLTVSLAPAEIKKEGPVFDVPIAISYLIAVGDIIGNFSDTIFVGELSLGGDLQPLRGALALATTAKKNGFKKIILPDQNKEEASIVSGIEVLGARNIKEVVEHLLGARAITPHQNSGELKNKIQYPDIGEVRGQLTAKRALQIAAAGGHNICMYGPPGTGKTMLAKAFTGLLPDLSEDESFEVTTIHSIAGQTDTLLTQPPMRAPHHTSSYVSIIGGGSTPKSGEITLSHRGVLFLDELPEFESKALESLREPLEEGVVRISRAKGTETFPASFILVAAMNPCPCGYYGSKVKECVCKSNEIERYQKRISGPIIDRIDMWTLVQHLPYEELSKQGNPLEGVKMKSEIKSAREFSERRFLNIGDKPKLNKSLSTKELSIHAKLGTKETETLNRFAKQFQISPRSYHRIIRLARTIADLEQSEQIQDRHVIEAFQYRPKLQV